MQTDTIIRTLPGIDETVAAETGDAILLDVTRRNRVKTVAGTGRRSEVRAWTKSGNVD